MDIAQQAPRLWNAIPSNKQAEASVLAEKMFREQEFAPSGFPEGTGHGPSHLAMVLEAADTMLGCSPNLPDDLNGTEAYLTLTGTLIHDIGLVWGRREHAQDTRLKQVNAHADFPLSADVRDVTMAVAAAHSGPRAIEELQPGKVKVLPTHPPCDLRKVAALIRLADEISEDPRRTSGAMIGKPDLPSNAKPYHLYSAYTMCYVDDERDSIVIDIACSKSELTSLHGEPGLERTLLSHFLDRCVKTESERQYCGRFLPRHLVPATTSLLLRDSRAKSHWCELEVPLQPGALRSALYESQPEYLLPAVSESDSDPLAVTMRCALRECFAESIVALVEFGSSTRGESARDRDFAIIVEDSFSGSPRRVVKLLVERVRNVFGVPLTVDLLALQPLSEELRLVTRFQSQSRATVRAI